MTWNYRAVRHPDGYVALHEAYYDKDGRIVNWSQNPVRFGGDDLAELISSLEAALKDVKDRPIVDWESGLSAQ